MTLTDISQMSTEERLQMMEALWDALSRETPETLNSQWHEDILKTRAEKIKSDQATFISLQDLSGVFQRQAE